MPSEFALQKARSKLRGTMKSTALYLEVPGGGVRSVTSPGAVMLNSITVHPSDDCVFEVRSESDSLYRVYLAAGNPWSLSPAATSGTLSLVIRNRNPLKTTVKLDVNWTVI